MADSWYMQRPKLNIVTAYTMQWGLTALNENFHNVIGDHGMLVVETMGGPMLLYLSDRQRK